jgi:hypothetical protein
MASDFSPLFLSTPFNAELSAGTQVEVQPESNAETFTNNLILAEQYGALEEYRVLDGGVLIALDGVGYFSSENVYWTTVCIKPKTGRRRITTAWQRERW